MQNNTADKEALAVIVLRAIDAEINYLMLVAKEVLDNAQICRRCRRTKAEHNFHGLYCPQPWPKKTHTSVFAPIGCQANENSDLNSPQCERSTIPGSDVCVNHLSAE